MQQPPLRQTTTPVRRRQPQDRRPQLTILLAVAGALALGVFLAGGLSSNSAPGETGTQLTSNASTGSCIGADCRTPAAEVRAAAPGPTPCAYCNQDPNRWRAFTNTPPPEIGGKTAALIEASCGRLILGVAENERRPPASLTKIAAAMVTAERGRLSDMVDIKLNGWDLSADDGSTIMGLEAGMRLSVQDLLYGMLLASGNDAALTLAEHLGGQASFVAAMNAKAREQGLVNTNFVTADGRHAANHYSTALDMALLGRALMADPLLKKVVATETYMPAWDRHLVWNNNAMLYYYDGAIGIKTGFVEEGDYTIVTAAERDGRTLIVSVFGGWHLYLDAIRLLDWAFDNTRPTCG